MNEKLLIIIYYVQLYSTLSWQYSLSTVEDRIDYYYRCMEVVYTELYILSCVFE